MNSKATALAPGLDSVMATFNEMKKVAESGGNPLKLLQRNARRYSDELISDALRRSKAGETDWDLLSNGLGRNELPSLLSMVWKYLPTDQRLIAVGDAWTLAESPERLLERTSWLEMFRAVGYLEDDKPASPPKAVTLWRGGVKKPRMSWTGDRELAVWFQKRYSRVGKPGKLWTITVGPDRLLAHFHQKHRAEDEYVIDPTGLRPR